MESRPHVLYFSPNGYIGGAERFVLNICEAHLLQGQYRPAIVFFNNGEAVRSAEKLGIKTFVLPVKLRLSRPISVLKSIHFLRKLIKNLKPSIIHSTMPYSHLLAVPFNALSISVPFHLSRRSSFNICLKTSSYG